MISMLKIFNTLTKKKEVFSSIIPGIVNIYVCGVTVHDLCHIGHARTFIIFDIIIRYFNFKGYRVNYIRNITDIEDKIIYQSIKNNETISMFTNRMISEMHKDFSLLHILCPNKEPRMTEYINEIIKFIMGLLQKKFAYISDDGDVMFAISSYTKYGMLSHQDFTKFHLNYSRNIHSQKKYNFMDFVLWKISRYNEFGWPSPWGHGRPGWHIGCSTMSISQLGCHFDIHGGGSDLIFPHHENEIAQSVSLYGSPYVNVWIHIGLVTMRKKKISKSLQNFLTLRNIMKFYDWEVIRYFLISAHYRKPLEYTESSLNNACISLNRLYISLLGMNKNVIPLDNSKHYLKKFCIAMNDDFNVSKAFSILFDISHQINKLKVDDFKKAQEMAARLRQLAKVLGLLQQDPEIFLRKENIKKMQKHGNEIEMLIQERNRARAFQKWGLADKIRKNLSDIGIILEDTEHGTIWRR
ncbi:Cysteinine--tRNA ligase [Candidatus Westeberhardia cardiocondylae]|uniref:Cysteine--tRNA ligase n=2 Tax=Candidatus Westeberhardia cardiocondylae TaxID=1594731 RepID=A0A0H5BX87_9ENTR|nr:Cysteinine--tRNA ligase [Candidatus Westeberhardia cardiocondylae]